MMSSFFLGLAIKNPALSRGGFLGFKIPSCFGLVKSLVALAGALVSGEILFKIYLPTRQGLLALAAGRKNI